MASTSRGLGGKSLGAARQQAQQQRIIQQVPAKARVDELLPSPENPRVKLRNIEGLADTLRSDGVLTALTVVPSSVFAAQYPQHAAAVASSQRPWVVIHGHRRLAAATMIGLESVPVLVRDTVISMRAAAILENLQREGLTPVEEGHEFAALMAEENLSQRALAARLGRVSQTYISQRVALLKLIPELQQAVVDEWTKEKPGIKLKAAAEVLARLREDHQKAFAAGVLEMTAAEALAKLPQAEQDLPSSPHADAAPDSPARAADADTDCAAITPDATVAVPKAKPVAAMPAPREPAASTQPAKVLTATGPGTPTPASALTPAPAEARGYIPVTTAEDIAQALIDQLTPEELDAVRLLLA